MAIAVSPGNSVQVSATGSSVAGTIAMPSSFDGLHIANTSATLYVGVRHGVGAQSASLTTDLVIPPMGWVVVEANANTTGVAAIGSASGPTVVQFTPCKLGINPQ